MRLLNPLLFAICPLFLVLSITTSFADETSFKLKNAVHASLDRDINSFMELLDQITEEQENFLLAHWLRISVYAQMSGSTAPIMPMQEKFRKELKTRSQLWKNSNKSAVPEEVYFLSDDTPFLIAIDSQNNRLVLYENTKNGLKVVHDYYASIGKNGAGKEKEGDLRTPNGVYFINGFITYDRLARKYGSGAFPLNYPNIWDRYNHKTGSGIWLHGTDPATYSRPPWDSDGCIILTNNQILDLHYHISNSNTPLPILIGHPIQWTNKAFNQASENKERFKKRWHQWKRAMNKSEWSQISQFYSQQRFNVKEKYFEKWRTEQRHLHNTGFYESEVKPRLIIADSDNSVIIVDYVRATKKGTKNFRQYWKKTPESWLIIFEDIV